MLLLLFAAVLSSCLAPSLEGPEVLGLEPNSDVTVAVNSQENVTFECAVDAGSSLLWQVNFVQLQCNSPTDRFITSHAENGIFRADTLDCNNSTLTVTPLWFSNPNNSMTAIKCIAFNLAQATCSSEPPGNDFNHVIAFGRPDPPGNLRLEPSSGNLFLVWEQPDVQPVTTISYTVTINSTETNGENFGPFNVGSNTSLPLNFIFLAEEALGNSMCNMFEFFVVAQNEAGCSDAAVVDDTVPISPDVTNISSSLSVGSIRHLPGNTVSFTASFLSVSSCSDTFPVLNYTVAVAGLEGRVHLTAPPTAAGTVLLVVELNSTVFPGLVQDALYSVSVSACSVVICRQSNPVPVSTYSLQGASAVFFLTNVMVTCLFAQGSRDAGCVFRLIPNNGTTAEDVNITRNGTESSECAIVDNQRDGYLELIALEWESDATIGEYSIPASDVELQDATNYTQLTQCPVPRGANVVAIVVSIVVVLGTAIIVAVVTVFLLIWNSRRLDKKSTKLRAKSENLEEQMKNTLKVKVDPTNPSNLYVDFPMDTRREIIDKTSKPQYDTATAEPVGQRSAGNKRLTADSAASERPKRLGLFKKQRSVPEEAEHSIQGVPLEKRSSLPTMIPEDTTLLVELEPTYMRVHMNKSRIIQCVRRSHSSRSGSKDEEDITSPLLPVASQLKIAPVLDTVIEATDYEEGAGEAEFGGGEGGEGEGSEGGLIMERGGAGSGHTATPSSR